MEGMTKVGYNICNVEMSQQSSLYNYNILIKHLKNKIK
jgi:hypothetical protein